VEAAQSEGIIDAGGGDAAVEDGIRRRGERLDEPGLLAEKRIAAVARMAIVKVERRADRAARPPHFILKLLGRLAGGDDRPDAGRLLEYLAVDQQIDAPVLAQYRMFADALVVDVLGQ